MGSLPADIHELNHEFLRLGNKLVNRLFCSEKHVFLFVSIDTKLMVAVDQEAVVLHYRPDAETQEIDIDL